MRGQIAALEENPQYALARTAILDQVARPGWRSVLEGKLSHPDPSILTTLACAVVLSARPKRKESLDAVAVGETGKTWKALREFPSRIKDIAQAIEKVNGSQLLDPRKQLEEEKADAAGVRQSFQDLPELLRAWTRALEERMKAVRRLETDVFGDSDPRAYLQFLVKESTGKPNDRLVAGLLNAAAEALEKSSDVDATSLAKARFRHRKKSA